MKRWLQGGSGSQLWEFDRQDGGSFGKEEGGGVWGDDRGGGGGRRFGGVRDVCSNRVDNRKTTNATIPTIDGGGGGGQQQRQQWW